MNKRKKKASSYELEAFTKIRQRSIFPARYQASIVDTKELNYCVRDGNRCSLLVITTGMVEE